MLEAKLSFQFVDSQVFGFPSVLSNSKGQEAPVVTVVIVVVLPLQV